MRNLDSNHKRSRPTGNKHSAGGHGKKKSPRKTWLRAVMVVCCVLAVLTLTACFAVDALVNHFVGLIGKDPDTTDNTTDASGTDTGTSGTIIQPPEVPESGVQDEEYLLNILLIGSDGRNKNEWARSDSMLLVSINTNTQKIVATSLLRDMCVNIEGHYAQDKLNHAHSYGGPKLLLSTLKRNFNINISYYISVNFFSFIDIVDMMGGLEMYVTAAEIKVMNSQYISEMNQLLGHSYGQDFLPVRSGTYSLNGKQTLAYCRNRYTPNEAGASDFARADRQRRVLQTLAEKVKSQNVFQLMDILTKILPQVSTNMENELLKDLVYALPAYLSYKIESHSLPLEGTYYGETIRGMDMMVVDIHENMKYLHDGVFY